MYSILCGCGMFLFKTPLAEGAAHEIYCRRCFVRVTVRWKLVDGQLAVESASGTPAKRGPLAQGRAPVVRSGA
jgi:hypothetical protein